jgi:hypothetical protein
MDRRNQLSATGNDQEAMEVQICNRYQVSLRAMERPGQLAPGRSELPEVEWCAEPGSASNCSKLEVGADLVQFQAIGTMKLNRGQAYRPSPTGDEGAHPMPRLHEPCVAKRGQGCLEGGQTHAERRSHSSLAWKALATSKVT